MRAPTAVLAGLVALAATHPIALLLARAQTIRAAATVRPADAAANPNIAGHVLFTQEKTPAGECVTVDVSNLEGFPEATMGFHIHQYGDSSSPANVGGHFVPVCSMGGGRRRRVDSADVSDPTAGLNPTCGDVSTGRDCRCDEIHGLPPSAMRMPGDMGNIRCGSDGRCQILLDDGNPAEDVKHICQDKMSLYDGLRSVIGRSLAVHARRDNSSLGITEHGLGDAGPAIAYGTVGITKPGAGTSVNEAASPSIPPPEKAVCIFRPNIGPSINANGIQGKAIISVDITKKMQSIPDHCNMRVEMTGLDSGVRSFHFHSFGDLRYATAGGTPDSSVIGAIFNSDKLDVAEWNVQVTSASSTAIYETGCTLEAVSDLVGRSLTVHAGPDTSSPTIAMAVCGLANPSSCFNDATHNSLRCSSSQPRVSTPDSGDDNDANTAAPARAGAVGQWGAVAAAGMATAVLFVGQQH